MGPQPNHTRFRYPMSEPEPDLNSTHDSIRACARPEPEHRQPLPELQFYAGHVDKWAQAWLNQNYTLLALWLKARSRADQQLKGLVLDLYLPKGLDRSQGPLWNRLDLGLKKLSFLFSVRLHPHFKQPNPEMNSYKVLINRHWRPDLNMISNPNWVSVETDNPHLLYGPHRLTTNRSISKNFEWIQSRNMTTSEMWVANGPG